MVYDAFIKRVIQTNKLIFSNLTYDMMLILLNALFHWGHVCKDTRMILYSKFVKETKEIEPRGVVILASNSVQPFGIGQVEISKMVLRVLAKASGKAESE